LKVTAISAARKRRPRVERPPIGVVRSELRAVDGNRSPFFAALKRRVDVREEPTGAYRIEFAEQRQVVIPWLRIPLWTYWRLRVAHSYEHDRLNVPARTFLETGHVPAPWWL
jgi:hypothetical protein